jgi:hypothetical protein
MKRLLLLFLILSSGFAQAQIRNFSIKMAVNRPLITENSQEPEVTSITDPSTGYSSTWTNVGTLNEHFDEKPGFGLTSSFQAFTFKNFFIETGLGVQYYRYKRYLSVDMQKNQNAGTISYPVTGGQVGQPHGGIIIIGTPPRNPDGGTVLDPFNLPDIDFLEPSDNIGKTTTLYLQLPVTAGKFFFKNKLLVKAGFTADFLLQATEIKNTWSEENGLYEFHDYKDKHAEGFTPVTVNGMFQTSYFIVKNLGIDLTYQRSLNAIYKDSDMGNSYYNIFSVGVSYHFFKKSPASGM